MVCSSTTKYSTMNSGHHPRGPQTREMTSSSFEIVFFLCWNRYFDFMEKVSNLYIIHRLTGSKGKEPEKSVIHSYFSFVHRQDLRFFPGLVMRKLNPPQELALFSEF